MKIIKLHLILLFNICFISMATAKDIEQGTTEIGGNFDLTLSSSKFKRTSESARNYERQSVKTSALFYLAQNLGVGFVWEYNSDSVTEDRSKEEVVINAIGPGIAYNFSITDNYSLKVLGSFARVTRELSGTEYKTAKIDGFGGTVAVGISYFIANSASVDAKVYYSLLKETTDYDESVLKTSGLSTGLGLTVYLR